MEEEKTFLATVRNMGTSDVITLPKKFKKAYNIETGAIIKLTVDAIILPPISTKTSQSEPKTKPKKVLNGGKALNATVPRTISETIPSLNDSYYINFSKKNTITNSQQAEATT